MFTAQMSVPTQATKLSMENMHLVAYSWPSLDAEVLKVQRALLGEARRKLSGMPADCLGMICLQTMATQKFLPHVYRLIDQKEFKCVPIIWINPSIRPGENSKIVFRDEARKIVKMLF
jgi:hypothetical protein